MKPRKIKIHFNRINMQRHDPRVWTVHLSDQCLQVKHVHIDGQVETIFNPDGQQPRAYFTGRGIVQVKGDTAFVTC